MRVYLDACALNRLSDDRIQHRVQEEADAVEQFFDLLLQKKVDWLVSEVLEAEVLNNPASEMRREVFKLLSLATERIIVSDAAFRRADQFEHLGYGAYDALHLACAEQGKANALLTTDDRLISRANRGLGKPSVKVQNPVNWIKEFQ